MCQGCWVYKRLEGHCDDILCEVSEVKWSRVADVECSVVTVYIVV